MRLVTFVTNDSSTKFGAILADRVVSFIEIGGLSSWATDILTFLRGGDPVLAEAGRLLSNPNVLEKSRPLNKVRLLAPIPHPGKIVAIGLNYRDHALEQKIQPPSSPMIFAKFPSSISSPGDPIRLPKGDPQVDYEAELAVVIGRRAKAVAACDAMNFVFGYMPLNDVSARAWQFADKQWIRGKSCDTFCPIGPWLTTRDEVADPHELSIKTRVNGTILQDSNTSNLIFKIPELIAYISASITLEPGDIIATGTPDGVGVFRKHPIFLKHGDVVEIEIQGLGILRNPVENDCAS